jgi:3-oxoacyl-[acyl-carrier protein] reductase
MDGVTVVTGGSAGIGEAICQQLVAPGPIETDLFRTSNPPDSPQTRTIMDSIAVGRMGPWMMWLHAVPLLLDPKSGFGTGQTLHVCGGTSIGAAPI